MVYGIPQLMAIKQWGNFSVIWKPYFHTHSGPKGPASSQGISSGYENSKEFHGFPLNHQGFLNFHKCICCNLQFPSVLVDVCCGNDTYHCFYMFFLILIWMARFVSCWHNHKSTQRVLLTTKHQPTIHRFEKWEKWPWNGWLMEYAQWCPI